MYRCTAKFDNVELIRKSCTRPYAFALVGINKENKPALIAMSMTYAGAWKLQRKDGSTSLRVVGVEAVEIKSRQPRPGSKAYRAAEILREIREKKFHDAEQADVDARIEDPIDPDAGLEADVEILRLGAAVRLARYLDLREHFASYKKECDEARLLQSSAGLKLNAIFKEGEREALEYADLGFKANLDPIIILDLLNYALNISRQKQDEYYASLQTARPGGELWAGLSLNVNYFKGRSWMLDYARRRVESIL